MNELREDIKQVLIESAYFSTFVLGNLTAQATGPWKRHAQRYYNASETFRSLIDIDTETIMQKIKEHTQRATGDLLDAIKEISDIERAKQKPTYENRTHQDE